MLIVDALTDADFSTSCAENPASLSEKPVAAAIGFFDGVHLGHRHLLEQVRREAACRGFSAAAITFAQHPRSTLCTDYKPRLISSLPEKISHLQAEGLDACFVLNFTPFVASLSARQFMEVLRKRMNVRCLVIGYDHRFGCHRSETFPDYVAFGRELGIDVVRATELPADGESVSSSAIRRALESGDVKRASFCLGRNYTLEAVVVPGRKIGRTIGFPTANLQPCDSLRLIPARGVYAVRVRWENMCHGAMLNIGCRPTIGEALAQTLEAHIFDFNGDLYDSHLTLEFVERLRDECTFASLDSLRQQLVADAVCAKNILRI